MKRLHVSLNVADLDDSIRFYTALFAAEPTMTKSDYAKWALDDPRLNFSIVHHADYALGAAAGDKLGVAHLGIEAETEAELAELRNRFGKTGGPLDDEGETICCYHHSDKSWVTDGQSVEWEAFYTSGTASTLHDPGKAATPGECCESTCCAGVPVESQAESSAATA